MQRDMRGLLAASLIYIGINGGDNYELLTRSETVYVILIFALLLPVLLLTFLFAGCAGDLEPDVQFVTVELPEGSTKLYYLNDLHLYHLL